MTDDTKNMLLADALSVAIETEKKNIKLKRAVKILSVAVVMLLGVIIWIGI